MASGSRLAAARAPRGLGPDLVWLRLVGLQLARGSSSDTITIADASGTRSRGTRTTVVPPAGRRRSFTNTLADTATADESLCRRRPKGFRSAAREVTTFSERLRSRWLWRVPGYSLKAAYRARPRTDMGTPP